MIRMEYMTLRGPIGDGSITAPTFEWKLRDYTSRVPQGLRAWTLHSWHVVGGDIVAILERPAS